MTEIKISDLSIGDWVRYESTVRTLPMKVLGIGEKDTMCDDQIYITGETEAGRIFCEVTELKPIPLTPEILEKNGFVDYEVGRGWYVLNVADVLQVWLHRNSHDWTFQLMKWSPLSTHEISKVFINYTHQLQHALRLAGVEKEIEI